MELLRFATAGSVDDGKSTLIGRLLFDAKGIFEDQLEAVERASRQRGEEGVNLALLTDGLRAEREQGITIDVAYRYFATPKRKFIIADTPGHVQYTRNMVTGASTADAALVLVDARKGFAEQSRRHAAIAGLLRVPHLVVCVNKIDLVGFSQSTFEEVKAEAAAFVTELGFETISYLPVSALHGDNVVTRSERTPFYSGPALLELLEGLPAQSRELADRPFRFPVQWVVRPDALRHPDFRGYAGQIASGTVRVGDEVLVQPSGKRTRIKSIETPDGPLEVAQAPASVVLRLSDELDISRGDLLAEARTPTRVTDSFEARLCWLAEAPLALGAKLVLKHATRTCRARVEGILERLDVVNVDGQAAAPGDAQLALNDLGRVRLRTTTPLAVDGYAELRTTGSFILIDEVTHNTVGAGMIV